MAKAARSISVPKGWEEYYRTLTGLTDAFCREHLNGEYAELARYAIAALCRKRPSPLASGRPQTWACGVLYALGQANFLHDRSGTPHMSLQDLCARFGVAASTGGNKARQVRDALGIRPFDHRWMLPSLLEDTGLVWMVEVDGLIADARQLPRVLQEDAARRGLIPYVWADRHGSADDAERQKVLGLYDTFRDVNRELQTALAEAALAVDTEGAMDIAKRLGLVKERDGKPVVDLNDLAPALDLALFEPGADGMTAVQRHLAAAGKDMAPLERQVAEAMAQARFGVFNVLGRHPVAGLRLGEAGSGEEIWLVDRALEETAPPGIRLAMRVFRPEAFFMSTGLALLVNDRVLASVARTAADPGAAPSAEAIVKAVLSKPRP